MLLTSSNFGKKKKVHVKKFVQVADTKQIVILFPAQQKRNQPNSSLDEHQENTWDTESQQEHQKKTFSENICQFIWKRMKIT